MTSNNDAWFFYSLYIHGIICYYGLGTCNSDVWSYNSLSQHGIICNFDLGSSDSDVLSCRYPALGGSIPGLPTMEWTCVWNGVEMIRNTGVLTSQVLVQVQIAKEPDGLWLEWKLVPPGTRRYPALGGSFPGLSTMEWICVWNGVEMVRNAGVAHIGSQIWTFWSILPR